MDEPRQPLQIPTELERKDSFIEGAVLASAFVLVLWGWQNGQLWWTVPVVLAATVYVITGEAACDWQGIGPIASGLRNLLGLRRAHEWLLAWGHYTACRTVPDFLAWWQSSPSAPVAPKYPRILVS